MMLATGYGTSITFTPLTRYLGPLAIAIAGVVVSVPASSADGRPDFAGVWALDAARSDVRSIYGQMRIVETSAEMIRVAVVQFLEPARTVTIYPWQYTFGGWMPRRGGQQSKEPLTRAEWDGSTLVTAKAPGTDYSLLQAWTRSGGDLRVQNISKSVPFAFDFMVAGLSRAYLGDVLTYTRIARETYDCPHCYFALGREGIEWVRSLDVPLAFRLVEQSSRIEVACGPDPCIVTDILHGRRQQPRGMKPDQRLVVPLSANTVVERPSRRLTPDATAENTAPRAGYSAERGGPGTH